MKKFARLTSLYLLTLASAWCAAIPGLFNTGVKGDGTLAGNAERDSHYALVASDDPDYLGPNVFTLTPGFPVGPWLTEGPNSKWIAPRPEQGTGNVPGNYKYRIAFDLTGFDPSRATIQGQWATDNNGTDILINGSSTGQGKGTQFAGWTSFSITNGFVAGTNTLDFVVRNDPTGNNPTGIRVELSGTAPSTQDPAPHLQIDLVPTQAGRVARLTVDGVTGAPHRIDYVEKLTAPGPTVWKMLTNFNLTPNPRQIIDSDSAKSLSRIYRAVTNP